MLYRIRVFLETNGDDVYRDIEIKEDDSLEDLHNVIVQSFDFQGDQMASFYLTDDDLNQGMEIPLFNMDETSRVNNMMSNTLVKDVLDEETPNLIYVYDFLSMWRFLVGFIEKSEPLPGVEYPQVAAAQGMRPEDAPEIEFADNSEDDRDIFGEENPFGEFYGDEYDEWN